MDVMQFLLGPIRKVSGFCGTPLARSAVPDMASVNLIFDGGVPGVYMTNQVSVYVSRLTIYGTEGALHLNRFGQELVREELIDIREAQKNGPKQHAVEFTGAHPYTTALQEELEDFARCVRTGGKPEVGGAGGHACIATGPGGARVEQHRPRNRTARRSGVIADASSKDSSSQA
ncbi:MAG: Gfo/Idh/MocA family protein [Opitutaceae bacterium]